ncbi:hypothetical protein ACFV16_22590 [Streptomyces massasporeus]|uniref:hypothetical protein n=1 Tax=Streptomyces massasporeus TaxID=67324 RepID=UPI0036A76287
MSVRSIPATAVTPAHLVSTTPYAKVVYVQGSFKGAVFPMKTPGFFIARDIDRKRVVNPDDPDGLWTSEQDALDFLARN